MRLSALGVLLIVGVAACGDPDTNDARGYTKAPLEEPGVLVAGEEASAMAELGEPDLLGSEDPAGFGGDEPAGGSASGGQEEQAVTLADGVTQEQFDQGQELYAGQGGCQACHGANGSGSQLAPNLADDEWLNLSDPTVDNIAQVIRNGVSNPQEYPAPMPPMGGASLTADQVQALAGYVASLSQG